MLSRKLTLFILVFLGLLLVPAVYATQPSEIHGYFDEYYPGDEDTPTTYCLHTLDDNGVPDGFIDGCVVQPYKPGLDQLGTFTGTADGKYGSCEYSLRTFDLDGIARFSMHRCDKDGELAGFHLSGVGWTTGFWEGSYHFDP